MNHAVAALAGCGATAASLAVRAQQRAPEASRLRQPLLSSGAGEP